MARREAPEINAGSMADIAFLLLIFFLVTTTMDTDTGLTRRLPPPPEDIPEDIDQKVKKRNIFEVLVNANDDLLVEGQVMLVSQLREAAKEFIVGDRSERDESLPEFKTVTVPVFGDYRVSKQIVSLQNDRGTSYEMYIKVQNELVGAYNEVRDEFAKQEFGMTMSELEKKAELSKKAETQIKAVKKVYPQRISEAEPKSIGGIE